MSQVSYAAVAAGASPTTTTNPHHPPPQGTLNAAAQGSSTTTPTTATYTKATPDLKKPAKDGSDAPPAYGAEGTFPVHPQPDVEAFPQLPSHNGREGGGGPPPPTPHPNSTVQNGSTAYHMHYREPTWLRFIKALGTAVLIYLLASMLVESMYLAAHWGMGRHRHHDHLPRNYDVPADVKLHQCATSQSWQKAYPSFSSYDNSSTEYPYAAQTSFSLPLGYADEATVVVLSRGRWLSGNVNVVSSATQEWGQASVDVTVKYFRDNARDEVRACLVEREDGGRGVGIFTPEHKWDWNDDHEEHQVYYETTLVLPEGVPLWVKKLETDVPNSSLHLNLDGTHVVFDDVVLKGSNAHVQIDVPLAAKKASIQYTDSPIVGHFNVTDELTIETSNARVEASVTMYRIQKYDNIPSLDITTSNGVLHTNILLLDAPSSSSMKSTHPHYNIKTTTSNAQLDVSFTGAPIDAVLSFEGSTKNGGASARLYQTYSGSYEIWTRNSAADLIVGCPGGIEVPPKASQQLIVNDGKVERAVGGGKACKGGVTMVRDEISKKNYKKGVVEWVPVDSLRKELESSVVLSASNGAAVVQI